MVSSVALNVEESVELNNIGNGGVENAQQACKSSEDLSNPRTQFWTRCLTLMRLRSEVAQPLRHHPRTEYDTIISVCEACDNVDSPHEPVQTPSPRNSLEEKGIKIASLDRVFSSFLFASGDQKRELLRIAKLHDENQDRELNRHEFERMKINLAQDHPDLHKIFVAVPERYTKVPVFILSTTLLIVCVKVFHTIHYHKHHSDESYPKCSHLIYDIARKAEVWRIIAYTYAHRDICHCLLNVAMLLIVGVPLEMVHGAARVATVWFLGSIGGVAGFAMLDRRFDDHSTGILTGASAAISALVGGHFASFVLNWKEDYIARVNTLPCCPRRSIKKLVWNLYTWIKITGFLLFVGQDIVAVGFKQAFKYDKEAHENRWWTKDTSFTSHFSGLIVGILVGLVILENRNKESWEKVVRIIAAILIVVAGTAAIVVVSVDAITKKKNDESHNVPNKSCGHKYKVDKEAIALDVTCAVIIALIFVVFCILLCTKGKRKMFRTLYARNIGFA